MYSAAGCRCVYSLLTCIRIQYDRCSDVSNANTQEITFPQNKLTHSVIDCRSPSQFSNETFPKSLFTELVREVVHKSIKLKMFSGNWSEWINVELQQGSLIPGLNQVKSATTDSRKMTAQFFLHVSTIWIPFFFLVSRNSRGRNRNASSMSYVWAWSVAISLAFVWFFSHKSTIRVAHREPISHPTFDKRMTTLQVVTSQSLFGMKRAFHHFIAHNFRPSIRVARVQLTTHIFLLIIYAGSDCEVISHIPQVAVAKMPWVLPTFSFYFRFLSVSFDLMSDGRLHGNIRTHKCGASTWNSTRSVSSQCPRSEERMKANRKCIKKLIRDNVGLTMLTFRWATLVAWRYHLERAVHLSRVYWLLIIFEILASSSFVMIHLMWNR